MPCTDWAAAKTDAGAEYRVALDLERLGLRPFCPECRRYYSPCGAITPLVRAYPLIPKHLFLPLADARSREVHYVSGLQCFINDADGKMWAIPDDAIFEVALAQHTGQFDTTTVTGNRVRLYGLELFLSCLPESTAALFAPLIVKKSLDESKDRPCREDPDQRPAAAGCGPHG
jgi:hypothetical protein